MRPRTSVSLLGSSMGAIDRAAGIVLSAGLIARWFLHLPSLLLSFSPSLLLSLVNAGKTRPSLSNARPPRSNSGPGPSTFRLFSSNSGPLMSISLPGPVFSLHVRSFHYPAIELHGSAPAFPRPILEFHGSARLSSTRRSHTSQITLGPDETSRLIHYRPSDTVRKRHSGLRPGGTLSS